MEEKHLFTNTDIRKLLLPIMVEQLLAVDGEWSI